VLSIRMHLEHRVVIGEHPANGHEDR
jgi:hypothetical protein